MASAKVYAQTFSSEGITRDSMHMLDRTMFKELGIKSMGDVLIILKLAKENLSSPATLVKPNATNNRRRNMMEIQTQRNACRGCGSFQHDVSCMGSNMQSM